jgi:hypothetical protein
MELKDILLFAGPLLGVILGAGISSISKWLELRHARRLDLTKIRIQRLEELHRRITNFVHDLGTFPNRFAAGIQFETRGNRDLTAMVQDLQRSTLEITSGLRLYTGKWTGPLLRELNVITAQGKEVIRMRPNFKDDWFQPLTNSAIEFTNELFRFQGDIEAEVSHLLGTPAQEIPESVSALIKERYEEIEAENTR